MVLDDAVLARRAGRPISRSDIVRSAAALAAQLPPRTGALVNLCSDRGHFLTGLLAAILTGRRTVLPPNPAPEVVARLRAQFAGSAAIDDAWIDAHVGLVGATARAPMAFPDEDFAAASLFTSGSTGEPRRHDRTWSQLCRGTQTLAERLMPAEPHNLVATMPPQHMFGLEASVLLPLLGGHAVDSGRPLFPEDVRQALARLPEPRGLLTTPLHLRKCLEDDRPWPGVAFILSATAPLTMELAARAEERLGGTLTEIYGSTETGALASRRTAHEQAWLPLPGVSLWPADGAWRARGGHFTECELADRVELQTDGRFHLRGRDADMLKIAGKRASLAELTRALLSIRGVDDAVVLPPPGAGRDDRRVMALVVAPGLNGGEIRDRLRQKIEPAFLPRPLLKVDCLPRNATGKLPLEALEALLRSRGRR